MDRGAGSGDLVHTYACWPINQPHRAEVVAEVADRRNGLRLTAIVPPIGLIILGLLVLWVGFKIIKGGTMGLIAVFSMGKKNT